MRWILNTTLVRKSWGYRAPSISSNVIMCFLKTILMSIYSLPYSSMNLWLILLKFESPICWLAQTKVISPNDDIRSLISVLQLVSSDSEISVRFNKSCHIIFSNKSIECQRKKKQTLTSKIIEKDYCYSRIIPCSSFTLWNTNFYIQNPVGWFWVNPL